MTRVPAMCQLTLWADSWSKAMPPAGNWDNLMGTIHPSFPPTKTDRIPDRGWTPSLPSSGHTLETIVTNFVNVMETGVTPPVSSKRSFAPTQTSTYATAVTPQTSRQWTSTESGRGYLAKAKATAQLTQPTLTRPPLRAPPTGKGGGKGKTPPSTAKGKGKTPSYSKAGKGQTKHGYVNDGYNWHPIAKAITHIVGISASGSVVLDDVTVANPNAESDVMDVVD